MKRWLAFLIPSVFFCGLWIMSSCSRESLPNFAKSPLAALSRIPASGTVEGKSLAQMKREVNVHTSIVKKGVHCRRKIRPLKPRYITIHSTQNFASGADAWRHAKALHGGKLRGGRIGYMGWHFTVDQSVAVQHLPLNEQGDHADFDGPGNKYSIGIEMCEHRGNNLSRTIDRTAKLTAVLMYEYRIPIRNVVPHYHWPRKGYRPANKNCPHFLLDNGRPGRKWAWFQSRVNYYHRQINSSSRMASR